MKYSELWSLCSRKLNSAAKSEAKEEIKGYVVEFLLEKLPLLDLEKKIIKAYEDRNQTVEDEELSLFLMEATAVKTLNDRKIREIFSW